MVTEMAKNKKNKSDKVWTRESAIAAFKADEIDEDEFNEILNSLEKKKNSQITFKVSAEKKVLCVYGLQIRPVSLYVEQWERLIDPEVIAAMKEFIEEHPELARRDS